MADGRGGARAGAGRPRGSKSQRTILKERALEDANGDAEEALAFIISVMHDTKAPIRLRVDCAKDVADRVFGKATQRNENVNSGEQDLYIHWDD